MDLFKDKKPWGAFNSRKSWESRISDSATRFSPMCFSPMCYASGPAHSRLEAEWVSEASIENGMYQFRVPIEQLQVIKEVEEKTKERTASDTFKLRGHPKAPATKPFIDHLPGHSAILLQEKPEVRRWKGAAMRGCLIGPNLRPGSARLI
ncbi:MAG: hypothetical protein M1816_006168 [Peltula sp. TS41687]|nr:MAG: hypothetical protein M1816_006168 [Peltula sp. TS41687]